MIDEGVAQLLREGLVSIVLLVKVELASRLGLLSFPLHFSLNTGPNLGKVYLPGTISPSSLGHLFPKWLPTPQPMAQTARVFMLPRVFSRLRHMFSAPCSRVTPNYSV